MIGLAIIGSVACVRFAPASIAATGSSDPREVVMDEFAGQAITFHWHCRHTAFADAGRDRVGFSAISDFSI